MLSSFTTDRDKRTNSRLIGRLWTNHILRRTEYIIIITKATWNVDGRKADDNNYAHDITHANARGRPRTKLKLCLVHRTSRFDKNNNLTRYIKHYDDILWSSTDHVKRKKKDCEKNWFNNIILLTYIQLYNIIFYMCLLRFLHCDSNWTIISVRINRWGWRGKTEILINFLIFWEHPYF